VLRHDLICFDGQATTGIRPKQHIYRPALRRSPGQKVLAVPDFLQTVPVEDCFPVTGPAVSRSRRGL